MLICDSNQIRSSKFFAFSKNISQDVFFYDQLLMLQKEISKQIPLIYTTR